MAGTQKKRFKTGQEIMDFYVPNYVPVEHSTNDRPGLGVRSGEEAAQPILLDFKNRLSKKKQKKKRNH